MNGPELKCTLDGLGVTPVWFAARCGAVRRSVIRWCDGEAAVPERAILELKKIQAHTEMVSDGLRVAAMEMGVLLTYRTDRELWRDTLSKEYPALWHRLIVARLAADGGWPIEYMGEEK